MTVYLRFKDLKARGIINNHTTLQNWIRKRGFPIGSWIGDNTHVWAEDEIDSWLDAQPKQPTRPRRKRKNGDGDADG
jgi:hypothetical protein